jgi:hemerythrin superfamily protein
MASAHSTTDHGLIRRWVESRGGAPAHVKGSGSRNDPGILRIDYPGYSGGTTLERLPWKTFFDAFERNGLAFLYQDRRNSRFSKFVHRQEARGKRGNGSSARRTSRSSESQAESGVNALDLLKQQHRQVEQLFKQMKSARTVAQKRRILRELGTALTAHTRIEEQLFYPAVFGEETEEILRESVEEHLVAKRVLADLMKMQPSDEQFMGKASVLEEAVRHHVQEEENELFKRVQKMETEDLNVLGACLEKRFQEVKGEALRALPKETRAAVVKF